MAACVAYTLRQRRDSSGGMAAPTNADIDDGRDLGPEGGLRLGRRQRILGRSLVHLPLLLLGLQGAHGPMALCGSRLTWVLPALS